jgi:hypothetical protein
MPTGRELIFELMMDLVIPPILTGLWLLFASINNGIVDQRGKGSKIDAYPWRFLIQTYIVAFFLTLIHIYRR